jgi:hypothetical protein
VESLEKRPLQCSRIDERIAEQPIDRTGPTEHLTRMKINRLFRTVSLALLSLALIPAGAWAQATNIFIEPSGTDASGSGGNSSQFSVTFGSSVWQCWYANYPLDITNYTIAFDTNNPPPSGDVQGSVLQQVAWVANTNINGTQNNSRALSTFACVDNNFWGGATVDMSQFQSLEMDFKYDTNSTFFPTNQAQVAITVDENHANNVANGIQLTNLVNSGAAASNFNGAWHHLSIPIPNTIDDPQSKGPGFQIFQQATNFGTFNFWTANLELVARPFVAPPPTISLAAATPGLWQLADALPSYNRQDVMTVNDNTQFNVDWVGAAKPVTYSWTIGAFPGGSAAGFAADIIFTPDPAAGINYADPDWSSTNAVWLAIQANGDGKVTAGIAWKTNQPAGNSQFFSGTNGQVIPYNVEANGLTVPSAVGTWSLTFTSDTAFTITAPNGAHTNASLPAGIAAAYTNVSFFANSTMASINANLGNYCVYTALNITGVGTPVHETFQGGLNAPFLQLRSQGYGSSTNPPNQVFVTANDAFWLHWTLPDNGYSPVTRPLVGSGRWSDLTVANRILNGINRWALVPSTNLPGTNSGYFALVNRPYSQLQILFPGETAAPGTPTGKTGTPTPISISGTGGGFVNIIVNAVDSDYNLMTSVNDALAFTSSDPAASLPASGTTVLAGGTTAIPVTIQLQTQGNQTVTATDVTVTNKVIKGVSSPVSVTP